MQSYIDLNDYFRSKKISQFEGHSGSMKPQQDKLIEILQKYNIQSILEIGFNAGHSSELFLKNSNATVVSFDIGLHDYVKDGKAFIDLTYPNRHELIIGDSTQSLPLYLSQYPDKKFDLLFIDGGHSYEVAKADLENCRKFAHENSIVIMDDTVIHKRSHQAYTIGPTKIWRQWKNHGLLYELETLEFAKGRGMSYGKYNLQTSETIIVSQPPKNNHNRKHHNQRRRKLMMRKQNQRRKRNLFKK